MKLALFLTQGTSITLWKERGWLDGGSGIKAYKKWADALETFYLITYGGEEDLAHAQAFEKNMIILPNRKKLPSLLYSLLSPWIYRRELREVDVLFTPQMQGAWSAALAKLFFRKKFVLRCGYQWTLCDFGPGLMPRLKKATAHALEWICYRAADFIIVTSQKAKRQVVDVYRIPEQKIAVIPNAVDTQAFKPSNETKIPNTLLYIGRLEPEKNPFSILEAITGMDVQLTLCGSGSLEPTMREYALKHKLHVKFLGNLGNDQLPPLINQHDIFIGSSLYEGSPKAVLEAMSCGATVIATNVRGTDEVVTHKENGYLCEPSAASIRQALIEINKSPDLKKEMGAKARAYVLQHYDLNQTAYPTLAIFFKVAGLSYLGSH